MYNGRFCRDSIVNFTLVDLPYALNGTLEIRGLVTYNISDPNERVGNMSTYNIANCVQGNNSESREWLTNTHTNSSWMEERQDEEVRGFLESFCRRRRLVWILLGKYNEFL